MQLQMEMARQCTCGNAINAGFKRSQLSFSREMLNQNSATISNCVLLVLKEIAFSLKYCYR